MSHLTDNIFPWEPRVSILKAFPPFGNSEWKIIDKKAAQLIGIKSCLGIPSIRVGLTWVLEFLNFSRHLNHVVVPQFMGRCILNSIDRLAFPVEQETAKTKAAIIVHQFGFRPNLEEIHRICLERGLQYIEDSPCGLSKNETIGPGSLAKLIGLSKVLPILKGGLLISENSSLLEFIREKRKNHSRYSWFVYVILAALRRRHFVRAYSIAADIAYEMYMAGGGDNFLARRQLLKGLSTLDHFAYEAKKRQHYTVERLGDRIIIPQTDRTPYVVPFYPQSPPDIAQNILRKHGFVSNIYNFDKSGNPFMPNFEKVLLLPMNPQIPRMCFEKLLDDLAKSCRRN